MISVSMMGAIAAGGALQSGSDPVLPVSIVLSCSCAGSVFDASAYGHSFLYQGGDPVFNADPALVLYDVNKFVETVASSHFAFGVGDFDISFVAKKIANGSQGYDIALSTDNSRGSGFSGWFIELSSSRGFCFVAEGAVRVAASNVVINDGIYHTWRVKREAGVVMLIKDDLVLASAAMSLSLAANGPLSIGRNKNCPSYQFNGAVKNVVIRRPGYAG